MGGKFSSMWKPCGFKRHKSSTPSTPSSPDNSPQTNSLRGKTWSAAEDLTRADSHRSSRSGQNISIETSFLGVPVPYPNDKRHHSYHGDQLKLDKPGTGKEGRRFTTGNALEDEERERRLSKFESETPKCYVLENKNSSGIMDYGGESEIILVAPVHTKRRYSLGIMNFSR